MGDELVTAKTLGEWLDLSTVRISALGREGVLPREGDRRYPLKASIRAYAAWSRANPSGRRAVDPDLADEKRRLTRAQADAAELKLAQSRGELLAADEVAREWRQVAVDLRAQVLAIASRVTSAIGLDRDTSACLDRELRASLEDISSGEDPAETRRGAPQRRVDAIGGQRSQKKRKPSAARSRAPRREAPNGP